MGIWNDIRFSARLLVKDRWFTLAAAIALALGIGSNATVFTLVNAVLLRGLPFEHADRIVGVWTESKGQRAGGLSYEDFDDIRREQHSLDHMVAILNASVNLADESHVPERYEGSYVSWNLFRMIGQQPVLGRDFREEEDRPGNDQVLIISHEVWQTRYGGSPDVLGKAVRVNSRPVTIIGVMPPGLRFPDNSHLWIPRVLLPPGSFPGRGSRGFQVIARLAPGITEEQARTELQGIGERLASAYPTTNKDMRPNLRNFNQESSDGPIRLVFLSLMGAVGFVLLIACANVANLLLARSVGRSREIAIRASIGATRWRIVRQLLVESVMLATIGGVVGLGLSVAGVHWFDRATVDVGKPSWMVFTFDPIVFAFIAAICLATGVLFGLAPALHVSKTDVNEVLKENGRSGSGGVRARRWAAALIVSELVLTVVLLSGAGYMMRSFFSLYGMERGFDTSHLSVMELYLPLTKYPEPGPRARLFEQFEDRLRSISEIQKSALATTAPLSGAMGFRVAFDGRMPAPNEQAPQVSVVAVSDDYFDTIQIVPRRGRMFGRQDGIAGRPAAIVNERFVELHSARMDPLGRQVRLIGSSVAEWSPIVGVVPNIRQRTGPENNSTTRADPVVYVPLRASPERTPVLLVRSASEPGAVAARVRAALHVVEPDLPIFNIQTLEDRIARNRWEYVVFGSMFATFAFIALMLSAVGLYAVTSYSVTERTQEIGVRMALGAQPGQILSLVLRRAFIQMAIGLPLGIAGAYGVGTLLQGVLVGTGPTDVLTLSSIVLILVTVATAACLWPARRAAKFDPMIALRSE